MDENIRWILGCIGAIAVFGISVWWRVESRQDAKIDDLAKTNSASHEKLHDKIEKTEARLTEQHLVLRDKLELIWRNIRVNE